MSTKTILITGASSGIGQATARLFARSRYNIAIGARRIDRLQELKTELLLLGARSVFYQQLDVCSDDSVNSFCTTLSKTFPQIDILLNNAGGAHGAEKLVDGNWQDWQTMIDTNVFGLLRVTKAVLPQMIAAKNGHVINIGSIAGHQVYEGGSVYCASKHAVDAITRTLKLELNEHSIRVSTIDPGLVETEFSMVRFKQDDDRAKSVYKGMTPLTAEDIADTIFFVASRPAHVNIDQILLTPTAQASVYKVRRS